MTQPDEHAAGRGAPSEPSSAPPSAAQQLLSEITDRIARLQNDLAARDARIAQLETELRKTSGALLDERTARTRELERTARQISAELSAREKELEGQRTAALTEVSRLQTRERDLQTQLAKLKRQYEEARTALSQSQADAERLRTAARQAGSSPPAAAATAGENDELARLMARLDGQYDGSRKRAARPWTNRLAVSFGGLAIAILAGIAVWSYTPPVFRASALLIGAQDENDALERLARTALGSTPSVQIAAEPATSAVRLSTTAPHPDAARQTLASAGDAILSVWRDARIASTQPANARAAEIANRLAEIDHRLAAVQTQPAAPESLANPLSGWRQLLSDRQAAVAAAQAATTRTAAALPEEQSISVDAASLKEAEKADPRVQADTSTLAGREEQLAGMLRTSLEAGTPRFVKLAETTAAAIKAIDEHKAAETGNTADFLAKLVNSIEAWSRPADSLGEGWKKAISELSRPEADALALQGSLEPLARRFIDESASAADAVDKLMESLTHGGDEPTKRLVLRSALARELQPALDAREALVSAARTIIATENLELAAIRQRVVGLRGQVQQQRERIRENLKRTLLAKARARHDADVADARKERVALADRIAQLDTELLKSGDVMAEHVNDARTQLATALLSADLHRQRADLGRELAQLSVESQGKSAEPPRFVSSSPERVDSPEGRIMRAVLTALGILAGWLLTLAALRMLRSWRRSERELTNSLKALEKAGTAD